MSAIHQSKSIQYIITLWKPMCMQWNMYSTELLAVDYQSIGLYSCIAHFTQEPIQTVLYGIDSILSGSLAIPQHGEIHSPSHNELSFSGWNELNRLPTQSRQIWLQDDNNDSTIVIAIIPQPHCSYHTIMTGAGLQKACFIFKTPVVWLRTGQCSLAINGACYVRTCCYRHSGEKSSLTRRNEPGLSAYEAGQSATWQ